MPSTMIHLMFAHKIKPDADGLYYLGSFAPDALDNARSDSHIVKRKSHFRDVPDMEAALSEFYSQIDRNNPFHEGYFLHLICDMWWWSSNVFPKSSENEDQFEWYKRLQNEYHITGKWIRKNMPWIADVFNKIELSSNDFILPLPDPTYDEIIASKNKTLSYYKRDIEEDNSDVKPSTIFTPEFLNSWADDIAEKYKFWIAHR